MDTTDSYKITLSVEVDRLSDLQKVLEEISLLAVVANAKIDVLSASQTSNLQEATLKGLIERFGRPSTTDQLDKPMGHFPIEELALEVRTYNVLKRHRVDTIDQLLALTRAELLSMPNFGRFALDDVETKLMGLGLNLAK